MIFKVKYIKPIGGSNCICFRNIDTYSWEQLINFELNNNSIYNKDYIISIEIEPIQE